MRNQEWLKIKDTHVNDYLIKIPTQEDVRNLYCGCGKLYVEYANWFRYLEGFHPQGIYNNDYGETIIMFAYKTIEKFYDLETFHLKEDV